MTAADRLAWATQELLLVLDAIEEPTFATATRAGACSAIAAYNAERNHAETPNSSPAPANERSCGVCGHDADEHPSCCTCPGYREDEPSFVGGVP